MIRIIIENNFERAIETIKEVSREYRELGYKVWKDEWLNKENLLSDEVKEENFFIGLYEGKIATAFILQYSDKQWWEDNKDAAYIHKLCVKRSFRGLNMTGKVIITLTEYLKGKNIKYLRLDTGYYEEKVKSIYLRNGFKIVKVIPLKNGSKMALYELEL